MSNRLTTTANDIRASIVLLRSEAIKRGREVTLVAGTGADIGDWVTGWTVFVDEDADGQPDSDEVVIQEYDQLHDTLSLSAADSDAPPATISSLRFTSTGAVAASISAPVSVTLCDARTGEQGRQLIIGRIGRPSITDVTCP